MSKEEQTRKQDFLDFRDGPELIPPPTLSNAVKISIESSMLPGPGRLARSWLGVHFVAGALTLLVCPQFGIGPIGGGKGLMGFMEAFGHTACGLFCGAFFMSLTAIVAPISLQKPVLRALSMHAFGWALFVTLSSLLALLFVAVMIGREAATHLRIDFLASWIGAALLMSYIGMLRPRLQ
jgi:hypothetical protein